MNRIRSVICIGGAVIALTAVSTLTPFGWSHAHAQQADAKHLRLQLLSVGGIAYQLIGGGGSSVILIRENEVVLIDSKPRGWGKAILETIARVTDLPVTTAIDTHADLDHVGGQLDIPSLTTIVAHENTAAALRTMPEFAGAGAKGLPNKTVGKQLSLFEGADRVDLYHFGAGHTNGDLVVVLPEHKIAYLGGLFPGKMAPDVHAARGGRVVALVDTLAAIVREIKGVERIVASRDPGPPAGVPRGSFGNINTWDDLVEYAGFTRDFLHAVRAAKAEGQTPDQALARVTALSAKYPGYDLQRARQSIEVIYGELK